MLSKLRPRSIYDVMAAIACFVALAGGTAYAANTIRTEDIVDNQVFTTDVRNDNLGFGGLTHPDLGPDSVRTSEVLDESLSGRDIADNTIGTLDVADSSLNDEDISQSRAVDFDANIGLIPAERCISRFVSGLGARGDHLVLTPNHQTVDGTLIYQAEYDPINATFDDVIIMVCNFTSRDIDDGITRFNLLVIDAQ